MQLFHIMYISGYGGRLLRRLLSLDLDVCPVFSMPEDSVSSRVAAYKQTATLSNWRISEELDDANDYMTQSGYQIAVTASHCFNHSIRRRAQVINVVLDYDEFSNYWWTQTINEMDGLIIYKGQWLRHLQLVGQLDIPAARTINMTKFLHTELWQGEYIRICNELGIRIHLDAATELFTAWYSTRVAPLKAHKVSGDVLATRTNIELYGSTDWWPKFCQIDTPQPVNKLRNEQRNFSETYHAIKADAWPSCPNLADENLLPGLIRKELREAMNVDACYTLQLRDKLMQVGPHLPIDLLPGMLANFRKISE